MNMHGETIKNEIESKLTEDMGCVIFDFSCYFPYSNQEALSFDFKIGSEKLEDIKKNHRYPNKNYVTLSKKTGRSISKMGYPYFISIADANKGLLLSISIGLNDEAFELIFPVSLSLSKAYPVCALEFKFYFDKSDFLFRTYQYCKDGGWLPIIWTNKEAMEELITHPDRTFLMDSPTDMGGKMAIYGTVIEPVAATIDTVLI